MHIVKERKMERMNNLGKLCNNIITRTFKIRIKPRVLQLPITEKCNSKCKTCNVWKEKSKNDLNAEDLRKVFKDDYFNKIVAVGINGGEPFLHSDIDKIIDSVLSLKQIRNIYIISNGIIKDKILTKLVDIKNKCKSKSVGLHVTISVDGISETHELVRGIPGSFEKSFGTLHTIADNPSKYCDTINAGTTISLDNIENIVATKTFLNLNRIGQNYHLAVPNKRIKTYDCADYSVLCKKRETMLAREFFFGSFKYASSLKESLLAFQNYHYLINGGGKRISTCNYLRSDITIDENLNVYLCATASEKVGSLRENSLTEIVHSLDVRNEEKRIEKLCDSCGHYLSQPTLKGILLFIKEKLKPAVWYWYKLKCFCYK